MAFAGHLGVSLNVDLLVTEGDGIADSRADYGDSKNWAAQVERAPRGADAARAVQRGARRRAPGADGAPRRGDAAAARARPEPAQPRRSARPTTRGVVEVWRDAKAVFAAPLRDLHQAWDEVSWRIARLRDNPACADAEHEAAGRADDPGLHVHLTFSQFEEASRRRALVGAAQGRDPARAGRQQPRRDELRDGTAPASTPTTST